MPIARRIAGNLGSDPRRKFANRGCQSLFSTSCKAFIAHPVMERRLQCRSHSEKASGGIGTFPAGRSVLKRADEPLTSSIVFTSRLGGQVLVARNYQSSNLVRLLPVMPRIHGSSAMSVGSEIFASTLPGRQESVISVGPDATAAIGRETLPDRIASEPRLGEIDPLYLFACELEWERRADSGSAWEVIAAANSPNNDTRAHARALLERSLQVQALFEAPRNSNRYYERNSTMEAGMRTPYGLEIIESCMGCKASRDGFFCRFSRRC